MAIEFSHMTAEGRRLMQQLRLLESLEVAIGFQRGENVYEDSEADVVDIAAFNELGTSSTPARPFMRQSFENHEDQLKKACALVNEKIGSGETAENALNVLGVFAKGLVQDEIVNGEFEPNAPSTIAKKNSDKPLIDTGFMRQSVNYVVRKKRG